MKIISKPSELDLRKLSKQEIYHSKLAKVAADKLKRLKKSASSQMASDESLENFAKEESFHSKKAKEILKLIKKLKSDEKSEHEKLEEDVLDPEKIKAAQSRPALVNGVRLKPRDPEKVKAKYAEVLAADQKKSNPPSPTNSPSPVNNPSPVNDPKEDTPSNPVNNPKEDTPSNPVNGLNAAAKARKKRLEQIRAKRAANRSAIGSGIGSGVEGGVGAFGKALGVDAAPYGKAIGSAVKFATMGGLGAASFAAKKSLKKGLVNRNSRFGKFLRGVSRTV